MIVLECIEEYKKKFRTLSKHPTKVWLCPDRTIRPRIGIKYTTTFDIRSNLSELIRGLHVTKHWAEGDSVCIIFQNSESIQTNLFEARE